MEARILKTRSYPDGRAFHLVIGNLLEEPVEAIVNAANRHLAHGGGVAAAIAGAAGPDLVAEGDRKIREGGLVPTGEAVVTTAGRLPHRGVIHAVGPRQGEGDEETKLVQVISNSLLRAHEHGWESVSLPAISSGIFRVPLEVCARAYVTGVDRFFAEQPTTGVRVVRLCVFEGPIVALIEKELDRDRGGPSA